MRIKDFTLQDKTVLEIGKFAILWNLFEKTYCNNNCSPSVLKEIAPRLEIDTDAMKRLAVSDLKLRIATRKSALALAQTTMAADAIVAANAAAEPLTYELVSMTTEGDRRLDKSLASFGGKGVFIKELEIALLEDR